MQKICGFVVRRMALLVVLAGVVGAVWPHTLSWVAPKVAWMLGIVMFGMVAATGIRILAGVNFTSNRNNLFIVAVSLGFGMIPLIAPNFKQWMWHDLHPLIESGILLASIDAVVLNAFFNGASGSIEDAKAAASKADH